MGGLGGAMLLWLRWTERVLRRVAAWGTATALPWLLLVISHPFGVPAQALAVSLGLALSVVLIAGLDRPWVSPPRPEDARVQGRTMGVPWVRARGRIHWLGAWDPILAGVPVSMERPVLWARSWALAWALAMVWPVLGEPSRGLSMHRWWFYFTHQGLGLAIALAVAMAPVALVVLLVKAATMRPLPRQAPRTGWDVRSLLAAVPAAMLVGPWLPWTGLSLGGWLAWGALHGVALLAQIAGGRRADHATPGPAEDSGRVLGRDWVLQDDTVRWIAPAAASIVRTRGQTPAVAWQLDGFVLHVGAGATPWPVWRSFVATQLAALPLNLLVLLPALSHFAIGDFDTFEGLDGPLGWLLGTVVVGALVAVGASAIGAVLQALSGRTGGRVERTGRILRTPVGAFTLGDPQQTTTLTWGWRGTCLVLENPRERIELWGRHAELAWLTEQVQQVPELGSTEDIPEVLRAPLRERVRE